MISDTETPDLREHADALSCSLCAENLGENAGSAATAKQVPAAQPALTGDHQRRQISQHRNSPGEHSAAGAVRRPSKRHLAEAKRRLGLLLAFDRLREAGLGWQKAAGFVGVPLSTIHGWRSAYRERGIPGIVPGVWRSGRKTAAARLQETCDLAAEAGRIRAAIGRPGWEAWAILARSGRLSRRQALAVLPKPRRP